MIGWIRGRIIQKAPPWLLIDVHGLGYELETSMTTFYHLPEVNQEVSLYTHLWVREDAQRLFGFAAEQERTLFRRLIKVSGIGAKVALAILSTMTPDDFVACVLNQEIAVLLRVPGIGKRTAERLLVELKDGVEKWASSPAQLQSSGSLAKSPVDALAEAIDGLVTLGYKPQDASKMVRKVHQEGDNSAGLIRAALQGVLS